MEPSRMTYEELCKFFGEEFKKGGKGRVLQFERWSKQYSIEKVQGKKSLYDIRDYSKREKDLLNVLPSCKESVKVLLYKTLHNVEGNNITLDMGDLLLSMYLVNDNYNKGRYNKGKILEQLVNDEQGAKVTLKINNLENDVDDYYFETYKMLKRIVIESLNEMEKGALISYDIVRGKCDINTHTKTYMTNDESEKYMAECTKTARSCYRKEYEDLNYYQKKDVDDIVKGNLGYFPFKYYHIVLNRPGIRMKYDKLKLEELQNNSNNMAIDKINSSTQGELKNIDDIIKDALTNITINKDYKKLDFN